MVAPGALYSTFDMYTYYLDALQAQLGEDNVYGFALHNVVQYHQLAREGFFQKYSIVIGDQDSDVARAMRELILEIILRKPDVVFFIDGSKYPVQIYEHIHAIKLELNRSFITACYLTEAPYINERLDTFTGFFDVLFTNELPDVKRRDPNGERHVYYLPHSYESSVHYPMEMPEQFHKDVFFCGTVYPERAKIISEVNWSDIDAMICGSWYVSQDAYRELHAKYPTKILTEGMPNSQVADCYRAAKIVLSFNRAYGWNKDYDEQPIDPNSVYSLGPRILEAVACGAFVISEPRPELFAIFGDSMPTFTNSQELEELIRYYLTHPEERIAKAKECMACIQGMDYNSRASYVINILSDIVDSIKGVKQDG